MTAISGRMIKLRKLLPVKNGECGLRQSDAVFHHVQQLPDMMEQLFEGFDGKYPAIGVSLDSKRCGRLIYAVLHCRSWRCKNTCGCAEGAALYIFTSERSYSRCSLFSRMYGAYKGERFFAFHVSGGTTEGLFVGAGGENIFDISLDAKTLDLNAGQLIDRVGVMLGLSFPCGAQLEQLAAGYQGKIKVRPTIKNGNCCLSGIENICRREYENGNSKEYIAALCLKYVEASVSAMCDAMLKKHGELPVVFAGGVMSDRIIREQLQNKFHSYFAKPEYSTDNASGIKVLPFI